MRTARSRTSEEYLDDFLMAPFSLKLEPSQNGAIQLTGRPICRILSGQLRRDAANAAGSKLTGTRRSSAPSADITSNEGKPCTA